jgi:hypothetical protein
MLTVLQIISRADAQKVAEAAKVVDELHDVHDGDEHAFRDPEAFERFRSDFNRGVTVNLPDMTVAITTSTFDYEWKGVSYSDTDYDVHGEATDGKIWGLDFTPWSEWKGLPVIDRTGEDLTLDEIAFHLAAEIAWHGSEEDALERLHKLSDAIDDIDDFIASVEPN